ncbi:MAG: hypothetical protein LBP59_06415 [Planctomycetaceae bacterium]|nr:hypothetical protein [Planctomycetaceae bacterium]
MYGFLTAGQRPAVMKIPSLSGRRQNNENSITIGTKTKQRKHTLNNSRYTGGQIQS